MTTNTLAVLSQVKIGTKPPVKSADLLADVI